jgi:hypothetical protein
VPGFPPTVIPRPVASEPQEIEPSYSRGVFHVPRVILMHSEGKAVLVSSVRKSPGPQNVN